MIYEWVKAFHVIAIISWMAAMLYLPRLFVYHCDMVKGSIQSETFKIMERRLAKAIMTPAMIISWVLGLWLTMKGGHFNAGWFHAKLLFVVLLSGAHGFMIATVRRFAQDANTRSARFYRFFNEVPTILMIGIIIFVIVKPFSS
jgi:protoporphyrinogen IX oxidase